VAEVAGRDGQPHRRRVLPLGGLPARCPPVCGRHLPALHREDHWLAENHRLADSYFLNRGDIVLGQLRAAGLYPSLDAPWFSLPGGRVASGATLSLSAPAGDILYSLDGTDPRVYGTGAVSPTALTYREPVALERTLTVKAARGATAPGAR